MSVTLLDLTLLCDIENIVEYYLNISNTFNSNIILY